MTWQRMTHTAANKKLIADSYFNQLLHQFSWTVRHMRSTQGIHSAEYDLEVFELQRQAECYPGNYLKEQATESKIIHMLFIVVSTVQVHTFCHAEID